MEQPSYGLLTLGSRGTPSVRGGKTAPPESAARLLVSPEYRKRITHAYYRRLGWFTLGFFLLAYMIWKLMPPFNGLIGVFAPIAAQLTAIFGSHTWYYNIDDQKLSIKLSWPGFPMTLVSWADDRIRSVERQEIGGCTVLRLSVYDTWTKKLKLITLGIDAHETADSIDAFALALEVRVKR